MSGLLLLGACGAGAAKTNGTVNPAASSSTTAPSSTTSTAPATSSTAARPTTTTTSARVTTTTVKAATTTTAAKGVSFANCTQAKAAGYHNMHVGEPGYSTSLDRDGDGVACES